MVKQQINGPDKAVSKQKSVLVDIQSFADIAVQKRVIKAKCQNKTVVKVNGQSIN